IFFFQAEDGIRDFHVTGVQTCALPIWLYLYPSGVYLDLIADHLSQTVMKLQVRYDVERLVVVAHSMGGLVARGFVLRHAKSSALDVPLFVTISTPWAGHAAAGLGVKHSPVVLDVWR